MNPAWLYLGALYAIAVFLARRAGVDLPKRVAFFFYAAVVLFFFQPLTQRYSNIHSDILKTIPPWYYVAGDRFAANTELNDVPLQHVPWAHQVRESWKSLRVPLWNASSGSGYPLLANGQSSALSPIRIAALPLPLAAAIPAEAAMKLLIAMTFTFLFCRGRGYSRLASVIGGVSFGFAGFLNTWLHFPHVTSACFLPAVLYLVDRLAARPTRGAFIAAAIVWSSILYGGHPETASHIFFLALLYTIWIVAVEKRTTWRLFLTLGGAMTIAALLSAPFLLPFLEALPRSQRYEALQAAPLAARYLPYTDFASTVVLFQPHFFGRAPAERPWGPATTEPVGGFAGVLGIASFFALAARVVPRVLRRVPRFLRRVPRFLGVPRSSSEGKERDTERDAEPPEEPRGTPRNSEELNSAFFVFATLLVFGVFQSWPLLGDVIHFVLPVVAHARFRLLFVMLLAIQSAAAIDLAQRGERKPLLIGIGIVAAMLIALLAFMHYPDDAKRATAMTAAIPSAAVLVAAAFFASTRKWQLQIVVLLAVIWELTSITRGWNPAIPNYLNYPRTPLIRELMTLRANTNEPFRITAAGAPLFPNTAAMYGLEDVRAHDPMANARYLGFLALTAKYDPWNYHAMLPDPNVAVLDFLNVRYLVADPGAEAPRRDRWTLVYDGPDGRIFENLNVLPRFYAVRNVIADFEEQSFNKRLKELQEWRWTALVDELKLEAPRMGDDFFKPRPADAPIATTSLVSSDPTDYRLQVQAPRWTLVVSSIPWWPGWKVTRNGVDVKPIRVNAAFLGFAVPPGASNVRVRYAPRSWWVGVGLAAVGAIALLFIGTRNAGVHDRSAGVHAG